MGADECHPRRYVEAGDLQGAFASFTSDLGKHPETQPAVAIQVQLGMPQLMMGQLDTRQQMREWIEGFA